MEVIELIDEAKKRAGIASDYELAKRVKTTRAAVSRWRNEITAPDTAAALRLAALAGVAEVTAVAVCELARTREPSARAFWASLGGWRKR